MSYFTNIQNVNKGFVYITDLTWFNNDYCDNGDDDGGGGDGGDGDHGDGLSP
jgi:hypothetical protein